MVQQACGQTTTAVRRIGHGAVMDPAFRTRLAAHQGAVSLADLADAGLSPPMVSKLVRRGHLVRIQRGAFVDAQVWENAAPWQRHSLRARAVGRCKATPGAPFALSHHSALALHGIGVFGVDDRVHLVRTDGMRGNSGSMSRVHAPVLASEVATIAGLRVVQPALAALQVAYTFGAEAGLVSADAGLRTQQFASSDLAAAMPSITGMTGKRSAQLVATHAASARESAGESRCWWLLHLLGLPAPVMQARILDPTDGLTIGRVDFLFAGQRTVVEFDGMLKYGDESAVRAEKLREDRIREVGYEVIRLTWADLDHPERVLAKVQAAFQRAARRGT